MSPFLDLFCHCFMSPSSSLVFFISDFFSSTPATNSLRSSSFLGHQHSDSFSNTGTTRAKCSFIFVLMEMLFSVHNFSSPQNAAHARPILRLTSSSHRQSSDISPPIYTNLVRLYKHCQTIMTAIWTMICCLKESQWGTP